MSKSGRFTALVIAAVVVISLATYSSVMRNHTQESSHAPLLPTLPAELKDLEEVIIRKGGTSPTVTLHKKAEQWSVAERGDYPADFTKLRTLLAALTDAKIVEEKTSNPANFALIGVTDPAPNGEAVEVEVAAGKAKHAVIVGKAAGEGTFVRRGGENRSFIVQPAISVDTDAHAWIEPKLLDVSVTAIQSVQVKPATDPGYTIQRQAAPLTPPAAPAKPGSPATPASTPAADTFTLTGVPAGRKPAEASMLAPPASILSGLRAEDVAAASGVDFGKASTALVTLTDGTTMTVTGVTVADKHWIQIASSKDTAAAAKTAGRAFEIAGYRYDGIFRPIEQLLMPKETPADAKKDAAGKSRPLKAPTQS